MSQFFQIHPDNPQVRLIRQAVDMLHTGAVIVYPTDSAYALGCHLGDKKAIDQIRRIRQVNDKHNFTLMCRDLSEISTYAKLSNNTLYRILNAHTPGPYTFILNATSEVPRRLLHPRRRTIGIRVPSNPIAHMLLETHREPIMSSTLILPGDSMPLTDPYEIRDLLEHQVDLVIDGGYCGLEPSTVVDMTEEVPRVLRVGQGDPTPFE
jgi:tRNA threonylcarbamoyl adenosine modification protein (Sua5/YciO/YrdC/YwlC family)